MEEEVTSICFRVAAPSPSLALCSRAFGSVQGVIIMEQHYFHCTVPRRQSSAAKVDSRLLPLAPFLRWGLRLWRTLASELSRTAGISVCIASRDLPWL
jgi:hypothetical protein